MPKKILRGLLTALLTLLAAVVFYVAVILGEPQTEEVPTLTPRMDQPLLTASQPMSAVEEGAVPVLRDAFPAPMLQPVPGSGLTFLSGECRDAAFEKSNGRILTLTYRTNQGQEITVRSIYPARALSLVEKGDYVLSDVAGQSLAGLKSVRMENGSHIRLHAQGEEAIYVLTAPQMTASELISITRSLQLYEGE